MDEKYVTKLEFQAFRVGEFEALRSDVRELQVDVHELQVEFVSFREEVRGELKVVNLRIDHLTDKVDSLRKSVDKSMRVRMWIAGVYAVPMMFMLVKILVGTN
ncbi:hypothetical protein [Weissella cibaria]|uniref:DUF1640 domain-containing protein n=1 Tax=Weissella cibaria TaxID=137591 RepID=A0A0D1LNU9_9LACO|nr:hypothetical protein [Weissella cibaria]KIU21805.1 hypothetical protein QX99_00493 [Weissella cibaria]KIU22933.1 hypothetical protein ff3pr_01252 [Weissella cibaria]MDV8929480.1 hypothetical protein [Weissella cibaria]